MTNISKQSDAVDENTKSSKDGLGWNALVAITGAGLVCDGLIRLPKAEKWKERLSSSFASVVGIAFMINGLWNIHSNAKNKSPEDSLNP